MQSLRINRALNPDAGSLDADNRKLSDAALAKWHASTAELALLDTLAWRYGIESLATREYGIVRDEKGKVKEANHLNDRGRLYMAGEYTDESGDDACLLAFILHRIHGLQHHAIAYCLGVRPKNTITMSNRGSALFGKRQPVHGADEAPPTDEGEGEATA